MVCDREQVQKGSLRATTNRQLNKQTIVIDKKYVNGMKINTTDEQRT
jgi:hypothetical protein